MIYSLFDNSEIMELSIAFELLFLEATVEVGTCIHYAVAQRTDVDRELDN